MTGKDKCNYLKAVRMKIASLNGIEYIPHECTYDGPCKGTCPACEAEAEELMYKLFENEANGIPVKVDTNILAELDHLACTCDTSDLDPSYKDSISNVIEMGEIEVPTFRPKSKGWLMGDIVSDDMSDL